MKLSSYKFLNEFLSKSFLIPACFPPHSVKTFTVKELKSPAHKNDDGLGIHRGSGFSMRAMNAKKCCEKRRPPRRNAA